MTEVPPLDVQARRPVWVALSQFWLDTEIGAATAHATVRTILESPYSVDQAEAIHWAEVAPALRRNAFPNLLGEWAGFDEDWLTAECSRVARQNPSVFTALRTRRDRWVAGDLPDVVSERARRAQREGLPPRPSGPFVSLVASHDPLTYRVPW